MNKFGAIKSIALMVVFFMVYSFNKILGTIFISALLLYFVLNNRAGIFQIIAGFSYKKGNMDKALVWLKRAYYTRNSKPQIKMLYSYLLLKSGQIDEAERTIEPLMDTKLSDEDEMLVKSNYALILWKRGKLDEAVELLEKLYINNRTTTLYGSLGYLLILKGDVDRALKVNSEGYEYNEKDTVIIDNLAQTHYLLGNTSKAADFYEKLMSMNPAFPEAYYNYSLVLLKQKDYEKALLTVKKALKYKISYLSYLTEADIERQIKEIEDIKPMNH